MLNKQDPFHGWNAGFVALCLNFTVTVALSLLTSAQWYWRAQPAGPRST